MAAGNKSVCVVGLGYIGLPTAAMLASRGFAVRGYDINAKAVASINAGKPHFQEPDLQMLLAAAINTGQFQAMTEPSPADFFIIAVPTPFTDNKMPDLKHVDAAAAAIAPLLKSGDTVILESTSPVGTTERIGEIIAKARPDLSVPRFKQTEAGHDIHLCHCPERVLPGQMLKELVSNDRIVGGMTPACTAKAAELYQSFVRSDLVETDCRTAEFAKLVENSFRDVNIAFANELSVICDKLGISVWETIALANRHPRVNILQPGPGVGGHCIAVDPWFIVASAPEESRLIRTARETNDAKPRWVLERVRGFIEKFKRPVVACYGIAYKPDVDDLRESPSLDIVHELAHDPAVQVLVCEPNIEALPADLAALPNVQLRSAEKALAEADIVVFLVGHKQFKRLAPGLFLNKIVVDVIGLLR